MTIAKHVGCSPRLSVGFILSKRFTLCAFANFVDVLRLAADEGDRSRQILCEWAILSDTMDPIASSCGVIVHPGRRLGDPAEFDYIAVVGGLIEGTPDLSPSYLAFLRHAADSGVPLIGVCTGTFILHWAGLMHGYRGCVSWFHHDDFLEQFDGLTPISDQIFVVDKDRLTCSGGTSSAHLAAYLVDKHVGPSQAAKSLRIMMIDHALRAEEPQSGVPCRIDSADPLVKRALLLMQQNIDSPSSISELAERLGVSRRKLERHFMASVGMVPSAADKRMRLEHAMFLLRSTSRAVTDIALSTGFCDSSHFIRVFREFHGRTPQAFRLQETTSETDCAEAS